MGRGRRVFTPARTLEAEAIIKSLYRGPLYEVPVSMAIKFYVDKIELTITPLPEHTPSKLRGDLDNYVKLVSDALNGVGYLDDRQVHILNVEKA